jgi:SAM-dependent methyltransferase
MDLIQYWKEKHLKYSGQDWIDKPSIFAKYVVDYFPKNGKLLELGAGQGQDSRFFAEKGFMVTSTDFSKEAVDIAKLKTKSSINLEYKLLDIRDHFPFGNQSFDIVYSHMSIHYFNNEMTEHVFDEIHRVLRKNGILALLLNSLTDPEIKNSKLISEDLYETPSGLIKRFFSEKSVQKFTGKKFKTIILDSEGETFKDETKTLVRYIGKKI